MRMSPESFKYLLNVVGPAISKQDTKFRKAISASERLCLILHYLAYGGSQQSLCFSFRIAKSTISKIITNMHSYLGLPSRAILETTKNLGRMEKDCSRFSRIMESSTLYWCYRWKTYQNKSSNQQWIPLL